MGAAGSPSGWDDTCRPGESLLEQLPDATRETVLAASTPVTLHAGRWLFRAGDPADAMYVVRSGRLEVVREGPTNLTTEVLEVLGPGAALGELGLLTGSARSASVRARRDSQLLRLGAAEFAVLMKREASLAPAVARGLGAMLISGNQPRPRQPRPAVITLVSLQPGPRFDSLAEHVTTALETIVGPRRVTSVSADDVVRLDERGPRHLADPDTAFAQMLNRVEREYDAVVLRAGVLATDPRRAGTWTRFCLRTADRVVFAADPGAATPPTPEALRSLDALTPTERDLCFLGVGAEGAVARWLQALRPRRHHFVQAGREGVAAGDVGRMVRRLSGCSVGAVFSGGGARGFAHLGALDALRKSGISVDRVGGCSIGAAMAALVAQNRSHEEMLAMCRRYFIDSRPLSDYTIPRTALLQGRKLRTSLREGLGPVSIETLPLDFFCVSADLVGADAVIHRSGPLWTAVLASLSIPGLLPPVSMGGRLLVDGGVLNNLPIDVMADTDEGPVVAVDVMREFTGEAAPRSSRFRRRRVRSPAPSESSQESMLPPVAETLTRATVLGSWRLAEANRGRAAMVIPVPTERTGLLAFDRLDDLVDAGRRAAERAIDSSEGVQALTPGA
ncbi:MAG TPA: patatin-like phospholipase family protein [Nocardioidaceae bacterium]|nr:patatin-like phospholipase family protein [Nocardioidaceae bacterium]